MVAYREAAAAALRKREEHSFCFRIPFVDESRRRRRRRKTALVDTKLEQLSNCTCISSVLLICSSAWINKGKPPWERQTQSERESKLKLAYLFSLSLALSLCVFVCTRGASCFYFCFFFSTRKYEEEKEEDKKERQTEPSVWYYSASRYY